MTAVTARHAGEAAIRLVEVRKTYGHLNVVDRVSLAIEPGEFVTLLGPSGSGKTTTLMMIAGFVTPTTGRVLLAGTDITPIPPHRRNLGVVFQHYALFPHMTVADNVAYPLWMRRTASHEAAERIRRSIALVRLTGKENRYPRELSGGEQQRVALARALVFSPSALLMDEPLGALDRKLREHVQIEIRSLQRRLGITTIHVTHDQDEAFAMSDRIVVLNNGRVEQIGVPREIYHRPTSSFVAEFVGESNAWEGRIERQGDGGHALVTTSGDRFPVPAGAYTPGRPARMIVRPEGIRLASNPEGARLVGTLLDIVYVGGQTKYLIATGDGQVIKAMAHEPARERGERVGLTWDSETAHVYQEEG